MNRCKRIKRRKRSYTSYPRPHHHKDKPGRDLTETARQTLAAFMRRCRDRPDVVRYIKYRWHSGKAKICVRGTKEHDRYKFSLPLSALLYAIESGRTSEMFKGVMI
jgi:hypothetical protein